LGFSPSPPLLDRVECAHAADLILQDDVSADDLLTGNSSNVV
jgi:hypothetical protein